MTTAVYLPPSVPVARTAPGSGRRPRRAALLLTGLSLVVLGAAGAGAVAVVQLGSTPPPAVVAAVGQSVPLDGLELTVTQFERRKDAVAGVGTAKQPLSGPAMPMGAGMAGGGAAGMADMPGMAGMLEHGQERLDVSVVLRGTGDRPERIDADRFRVTSAGRPVELLQPTTTTLTGTRLQQGTGMRGGLVLVVPEGTSPLELAYGDDPARIVLEDGAPVPSAPHGTAHDGAAQDGPAQDGPAQHGAAR